MSQQPRIRLLSRLVGILLLATAALFLAFPLRLVADQPASSASETIIDTVLTTESDPPPASSSPTASSEPAAEVSPTRSSEPAAEASPTVLATATVVPTTAPTALPRSTPAPRPPIYPLAIMVDNFRAARPQTGLGGADVVYEALAEGGITRFLAIFTGEASGPVGPVRSARHYYVYWAAEYNAPIVHVMASDEGYAALVNTGLPDLDEHRGDPGFQRSGTRRAPFNTYVTPDEGRQLLAGRGALWPGSRGAFGEAAARLVRGQRAHTLQIGYPQGDHQVSWAYDRAAGRYLRSQAGAPHLDAASGQQISAAAVIVQLVPAWQYEMREGYLDMQLTGAGRAVYFQNGLALEGAWLKRSLGNPTEYFGPDNKPVSLRPGPIWIQILPSGPLEGSLSYSQ